MNLNELSESIEIFKKYFSPFENGEFPFELDYMSMNIYFRGVLVEKSDYDRLIGLGWTCNKSQSSFGNFQYRDSYSVADDEPCDYVFYFSDRR